MIDVESMIMSIKAAWIPRIIEISPGQSIFSERLRTYDLTLCMLLKGNITDKTMFPDNVYIPLFYKECIESFNKCKSGCSIKNVHEFLAQPIFCNSLFSIKGKCIYFKNWIESGFVWIKDLYDENGVFITSNDVVKRLNVKMNWISEYLNVKKVVERIGCKFGNKEYAKYTNIIHNSMINTKKGVFDFCCQKSKFFYELLIEKKCKRPYMEKSWAKQFDKEISIAKWEQIYTRRINGLPDKKLSEFVYKLMQNLILCRNVLFKWKRCSACICPICGDVETIKHVYFDCKLIRNIWIKISDCIKTTLTWEKIVLGFTDDLTVHRFRNLLISIVMYSRYKNWIKSLEEETSLNEFVKMIAKDLTSWNHIIMNSKFDRNHNVLRTLWKRSNILTTMTHL